MSKLGNAGTEEPENRGEQEVSDTEIPNRPTCANQSPFPRAFGSREAVMPSPGV